MKLLCGPPALSSISSVPLLHMSKPSRSCLSNCVSVLYTLFTGLNFPKDVFFPRIYPEQVHVSIAVLLDIFNLPTSSHPHEDEEQEEVSKLAGWRICVPDSSWVRRQQLMSCVSCRVLCSRHSTVSNPDPTVPKWPPSLWMKTAARDYDPHTALSISMSCLVSGGWRDVVSPFAFTAAVRLQIRGLVLLGYKYWCSSE